MLRQHEHVAEPRERGAIAQRPREADLRTSRSGERAEGERAVEARRRRTPPTERGGRRDISLRKDGRRSRAAARPTSRHRRAGSGTRHRDRQGRSPSKSRIPPRFRVRLAIVRVGRAR
jgi:hypothetical protein